MKDITTLQSLYYKSKFKNKQKTGFKAKKCFRLHQKVSEWSVWIRFNILFKKILEFNAYIDIHILYLLL